MGYLQGTHCEYQKVLYGHNNNSDAREAVDRPRRFMARTARIIRILAVNGTHRPPDALAPLINVRSGAEGDKQTPNVTKMSPNVIFEKGW